MAVNPGKSDMSVSLMVMGVLFGLAGFTLSLVFGYEASEATQHFMTQDRLKWRKNVGKDGSKKDQSTNLYVASRFTPLTRLYKTKEEGEESDYNIYDQVEDYTVAKLDQAAPLVSTSMYVFGVLFAVAYWIMAFTLPNQCEGSWPGWMDARPLLLT